MSRSVRHSDRTLAHELAGERESSARMVAGLQRSRKVVIQGFLWIVLAVLALAITVNIGQHPSFLRGLAAQAPNLLLAGVVVTALLLNRANRFALALWLVLGIILLTVSFALLAGGLQAAGLVLYFIPLVLSGLLLGRASLYVTAAVAVLVPIASTWLTEQELLILTYTDAQSDWILVLQYGLVLAMVTFFLDRFGSTLNTALETAAQREVALQAEVEERRSVERELVEAHNELELLNESLEERVQERTERLERANRELETFAYSVSHDLRSPLRGIAGFSEILREEYGELLGETGVAYLERILRATGRMDVLINDLLAFSRLAEKELRQDEVDLAELAREIAVDLNEQAELNGQPNARTVSFRASEPLPVQGDAHLLETMLRNLMSNAWKFMGQQAQPRVELTASTEAGRTVYCLRDNGIGFDEEYAEKIFMPFQRLDADNETGTGIGLATVQRIVQRHGGRIWARSAPGEGATFCFTLPARNAAD